jgi:dTDP-L-rhamnose 4-epimerase
VTSCGPSSEAFAAPPGLGPDSVGGVRILLTGAAGFIGGHLREALTTGDGAHDVVALDALLPSVHHGRAPNPPVVHADVRDAAAVATALEGVDAVCHQAAMVGLGVDMSDAPEYAANNDLGTAVLLAEMARAGVARLVLASSMVVYGEGRYGCPEHGVVRPGPRAATELEAGRFEPPCPVCGRPLEPGLVTEDAPLDPRNVYAATKLAQEHLAASWARSTGGSVTALRYHNVYGPRMPKDTPYAGVASLFRSALARGETPRVFEDGGQRRDFVHVTDVAQANVRALETQQPQGFRAYNVGSNVVHTVGEMATALAVAFGGPMPVVTGEFRLGDVRHVTASSDRAVSELGYRPAVAFEAGMTAFATDPLRHDDPRDATP